MKPRARTVAAVALVTVLGGEMVRVFFTILAWFLRTEVGTIGVIPYAIGPFLLAVAAAALLPTTRGTVRGASLVLVGARLAEQLSHTSSVDLWASLIGVTVFVWLFATQAAKPGFATGFLLGVAGDAMVRGFTTSLDLSWMEGWAPIVAVVVLSVLTMLAVWSDAPRMVSAPRPWLWISIGPLLFLLWQVFANQGWLAASAMLEPPVAVLWIAAGSLLGIVAADRVSLSAAAAMAVGAVIVGVVLTFATEPSNGNLVIAFFLAGWLAIGSLLGSLPNGDRAGRGAAVWAATGVLLFALIGLLFYTTLDLRLPLDQGQVLLVAGVLAALAGIGVSGEAAPARALPVWSPVLLLIVPVILLATATRPATTSSGELRVMSYNVAQGINVDGQYDPEGIARVIEDSGATVVGLQEVSRSWLIAGSTDTVAWLARRLGVDYAYGSAADGGNVILSRFPIDPSSVTVADLPKGTTLIQRSVVLAEIDLGGTTITAMNTHLQHLVTPGIPDNQKEEDYAVIQVPQLERLFDFWDQRPRTVLTGDFNIRPDWRQYQVIIDAGFVDGWDAGSGPGSTTEDNGIPYRIDYVFHTPDLVAVDAEVIDTGASLDHLPVVVTFQTSPR